MKRLKILILLLASSFPGGVCFSADLFFGYNFNGDPSTTTAANLGSLGSALDATYLDSGGNATAQGSTPGVSGLSGDFAFDNSPAAGVLGGGVVKYTGTGTYLPTPVTSFTITFWAQLDAETTAGARILELGEKASLLGLLCNNGGAMLVVLGPEEVSSNVNYLLNEPQWTFYAITYDSTVAANNLSFYRGTADPDEPLILHSTSTLGQSPWTPPQSGAMDIYIGNIVYDMELSRAFDGALDNVRLFGADAGGSGALKEAALDGIRRADLKNETPQSTR